MHVTPSGGGREPRRDAPRLTHDTRITAAVTVLFACVTSFLVVAPLTRRGWMLLLDWAPGPRGIGPTGANALPTGPAFVIPAQIAHALFGAAVGWLPIAVAIAVAAAGAATLVGAAWPARVAAGLAFACNPWVFDRIVTGQVSVLAGYAVLPWLARAALRGRRPRDAVVVGGWWVLASMLTLHFVWIGAVLVGGVVIARARALGLRRAAAGGLIAAACALAAVGVCVGAAGGHVASAGSNRVLTTFGTTSDPDLGRSVGILAEQGFWRTVVTRPRDDLGAAFPFVAVSVIGAAGAGLVLARTRRAELVAAVAIAGGAGWLLAHGASGPLAPLSRAAYAHLPGFTVMREPQKWVALVALALAVGLGLLAERVAATARGRAWLVPLLAVALAPTLVWGCVNRIAPSRYPAAWNAVRVEIDRMPGCVVALPWEHYIDPGITADRTVANIAPAYFGSKVWASDDARVPGLGGDHGMRALIAAAVHDAERAARAGAPVRLGQSLGALGVSGVLTISGVDDVVVARDAQLRPLVTTPGLRLWSVAGAGSSRDTASDRCGPDSLSAARKEHS